MMSINLMAQVFKYKFPKRVEYEALVYPFKRDKETKKILERAAEPEVRKLATTGSSCKAVMLALADHANDDGKGAYPSVSTLELKTNLERPTVISAVLALQYHLFINFVGESPKETNNYDISPERLVKPFDQGGKASLPVKVNPVYQGGKASLPESSFNHPEPSSINKEPLELFKKRFGKFLSVKELNCWETLYKTVSKERAQELIDWAFKKEIHLTNRAGLLDSLETAAKNWREKPVRTNGNGKHAAPADDGWLADKERELFNV